MKYEFKYKEEHDKLKCPCPNVAELSTYNGSLFRIVHSDLSHSNNYIPVTEIDKDRQFESCEAHCDGYALSFYVKLDKVEKHLQKYVNTASNFVKVAGSCIAEVLVCEHDGLVSEKNKKGHVNLHEFKNTNFKNRFVIVRDLKNNNA